MNNYLFTYFLCLNCILVGAQKKEVKSTEPVLKGHWKLVDTKIVDDIKFLNLQATKADSLKMVSEDSPWDHYRKYDLVFENDSMYKVNYPVQAFESARFFLDTGYLHVTSKNKVNTYPIELINDTILFYTPVSTERGYFKETFIRTNFKDSILSVLKKYGINYPELAGKWVLVREEDFDYGTHYELRFNHAIPNSIEITRKMMIDALDHEKIYMMNTDGIKRDYSFYYNDPFIYFKPGKWYKGGDDPWIHFYKKQGEK